MVELNVYKMQTFRALSLEYGHLANFHEQLD